MADSDLAIEHVVEIEGGYKVWRTEGDRGGQTCAGISRRANPKWPGWDFIDRGIPADDPEIVALIHDLYRNKYWNPIKGDDIRDQDLAIAMMSCAVLSGPATATRLMQLCVGTPQDGIMGPQTLDAINRQTDQGKTLGAFTLARIARYVAICENDPSQRKFFYGWCAASAWRRR